MIPASFVQDLLQRVDVAEIVGRHVALRKAGINLKGLCPFHGEKSPSFIVSPSRQTYHCFGCGAHGDAIRFLTEHVGLGFIEAVNDLAQQAGVKVPDDPRTPADREREAGNQQRQRALHEVMARACDHYRAQLKAHQPAIDYLKRRGLSGEVAAQFGLGYAPDSWRGLASAFAEYDDPMLVEAGLVITGEAEGDAAAKRYDRFRGRIMFPIRSVRGEIIGFGGRVLDSGEPKYLNSPETPVFVKGRELYGLYEARSAIRSQGYALVVEGYMDVVALAQLGLPNAVATLGTACTAEHVQKLFRFTESVVFSFDGDDAGRRAARRALEAALPFVGELRTVRFLFLPAEHDPDSYIREHGPEGFQAQVKQAWPLSRMLVHAAQENAEIDTPEGRARLLAQAKPLVALLPPGLLREQMSAEFARIGGLPADELRAMWADAPASQARGPAAGGERNPRRAASPRHAARSLPRSATTLLDRAASLILQRSDLWEELTADDHHQISAQPEPYGSFFAWLDRGVQEHGPLTQVAWLERLRTDSADDAPLALVARLSELHALDSHVDLRKEWDTVMRKLRLQSVDEELNLLFESGELSEAASARVRVLLSQRSELKAALIPSADD